jgi:amino acid transporter
VLLLTVMLVLGTKESAMFNLVVTIVHIVLVVFIIIVSVMFYVILCYLSLDGCYFCYMQFSQQAAPAPIYALPCSRLADMKQQAASCSQACSLPPCFTDVIPMSYQFMLHTHANIMLLYFYNILQAGLVKSKPANLQPFTPFGVRGIFNGAAIVFFSYIGEGPVILLFCVLFICYVCVTC